MLQHTPVLLREVLAALEVRAGGRYVDATFGRGGHSAAILERAGREGRVIAIDRDPDAIRAGRERFAADERLTLVSSPFSRLGALVAEMGLAGGIDGVLLDLGVSSPQLEDAARGFSFAHDGPLDMRMDRGAQVNEAWADEARAAGAGADEAAANEAGGAVRGAAAFVARASEQEIARVIREYGEERYARRIARQIVAARREAPILRTAQLAAIVAAAVPKHEPGKHPATRTFQAIRIHVNDELNEIRAALEGSLTALAPDGRLCVISFHSLEDGIVKRFMQKHSQEDPVYAGLPQIPPHARPKLRRVGRTVHPSADEVAANPRARSAVMRVARRLAA